MRLVNNVVALIISHTRILPCIIYDKALKHDIYNCLIFKPSKFCRCCVQLGLNSCLVNVFFNLETRLKSNVRFLHNSYCNYNVCRKLLHNFLVKVVSHCTNIILLKIHRMLISYVKLEQLPYSNGIKLAILT